MLKKSLLLLMLMTTAVMAEPIGALNPEVKQENIESNICIPGWTKTVRPKVTYTNKLKRQQIKSLHLTHPPVYYEEDHFIPLALGGHPSDPDNLWPQPWEGEDSARKKDVIETRLHHEVCQRKISLTEAQECVKKWKTCTK